MIQWFYIGGILTNYKLYATFLKISSRAVARSKWIGNSPVYLMRLGKFKELAESNLVNRAYESEVEKQWLYNIIKHKEVL